jgi:AraC-like DNA-binding protein
MIAVIERFTPWKSFPASIRELHAAPEDWRIRRVVAAKRHAVSEGDAIDERVKLAGLSRAHRILNRRAAEGLYECAADGASDGTGAGHPQSLRAISSELGFADPAHFTRFFRNHAGVSPREFRNVSHLAS